MLCIFIRRKKLTYQFLHFDWISALMARLLLLLNLYDAVQNQVR